MSCVLIQHYLNDFATLRQVSGSHRESVVREAFKDRYTSSKGTLSQPSPSLAAKGGQVAKPSTTSITKQAIFHYIYAVLHDPVYRQT